MTTVLSTLTALTTGQVDSSALGGYFIMLDQATKLALDEAQTHLDPNRRHKAEATPTANENEWVLPANILTEVGEGGLYHGGFSLLGIDLASVPVLPHAEIAWPQPESMEDDR